MNDNITQKLNHSFIGSIFWNINKLSPSVILIFSMVSCCEIKKLFKFMCLFYITYIFCIIYFLTYEIKSKKLFPMCQSRCELYQAYNFKIRKAKFWKVAVYIVFTSCENFFTRSFINKRLFYHILLSFIVTIIKLNRRVKINVTTYKIVTFWQHTM